jgi:hypothetical protein
MDMTCLHLSNEEISDYAYELWMQAGCPAGGQASFWNEAESLLLAEKKQDPDLSIDDPAVLRSPRFENL